MNKTLKKALLGSAVVLGIGAFTGEATADVFVYATINKDKDKTVTETITKTKTVVLVTTIDRVLEQGAEAEAIVNQRTSDNAYSQDNREGQDGTANTADMVFSIRGNTGATQFDQDAGNMSNQANVVAVGFLDGPGDKFVEAQTSAMQVNGVITGEAWVNKVTHPVDPGSPNAVSTIRSAATANMVQTIADNVGVTQVNQNAGNMDNQLNAVSIAAGVDDPADGTQVIALAESDLGQFNGQNTVFERGTSHFATMDRVGNENTGVTQVNQAAGNMVNQGNAVSLTATFF